MEALKADEVRSGKNKTTESKNNFHQNIAGTHAEAETAAEAEADAEGEAEIEAGNKSPPAASSVLRREA